MQKQELIVIRDFHVEDAPYLIVDKNWFEKVPTSKLVDEHGQDFGMESTDNSYVIKDEHKQAFLAKYYEMFGEEDQAQITTETIEQALEQGFHSSNCHIGNIEEVFEVLAFEEGDEFSIEGSQALAYNYFDGNNLTSITIECDGMDGDYEIMEGEEFEDMIEQYEDKEFIEEREGKKYYESLDFEFVYSAFASDFSLAEVIEKQ